MIQTRPSTTAPHVAVSCCRGGEFVIATEKTAAETRTEFGKGEKIAAETRTEFGKGEKIAAETRTEFGKGAVRRIRREDKIPAVLYGHGNDPVHITLPGHDTMMALKHGGANALLDLDIEGKSQLALTKQVQVDPIRRSLEHIDFVAVRRGEKVTVDIPIHVVGEAVRETLVVTENATVQVEAEATHIPEFIEVSVEGAQAGTQILASDLVIPEGSTLLIDPETLVIDVVANLADDHDAPRSEQTTLDDETLALLSRASSHGGVGLWMPLDGPLGSFTDALADSGLTLGVLTEALAAIRADGRLALAREAKSSMPATAHEFLAKYAGFEIPDDQDTAALESANTAKILSETAFLLQESLSGAEVAELLNIAPATVRDRKRDQALYAVAMPSGNRYPRWQFEGNQALPHLEAILRALPDSLHPLEVRDYFVTPRDWLLLRRHRLSVREWLLAGGDVDGVIEDARTADLIA